MGDLDITIPGLRLASEANTASHEHWRARQKRAKEQRALVGLALNPHTPPSLPVRVTITRIAPCALDDDNATGAAKAVRDAIARWLGVDDRSDQIAWQVLQARGAVREYAVRLQIASVRPYDPAAPGAQVLAAAEGTHVEATLARGAAARLSEALARGDATTVTWAASGVRLTLRVAPDAAKGGRG